MTAEQNTPRSFSINREYYNRELKTSIEGKFTPTYCIVFSAVLPFQLPLKDRTTFHLVFNDKASVYYFNKFVDRRVVPIYEEGEGIKEAIMRTRVEMACFTTEDLSHTDTQRTFEYLMHLTNRLNCYVYSYRMLFDDIYTYCLGQGSLHSTTVFEILKLPEWRQINSQPLLVNTNLDSILTNLPEDLALAVEGLGAYIATSNNPFLPSRKFFAEARRCLWLSNHRETIIYLQMTVESLLNNILRLFLMQSGKSESEVDSWMLETPFATRFKKWIPQFIGGNWDYTKPSGVVSNWFNNVYQARNRILHGGFEPSIIDGRNAFESVVALSTYVDDLLRKRSKELSSVLDLRSKVPNLFLHGDELPMTTDID